MSSSLPEFFRVPGDADSTAVGVASEAPEAPDSEEHADFVRLLDASAAEREELLREAARRSRRHAERLRELLAEVEGDLECLEAERADPEIGRSIGGWRLERVIGRGGSSRVYRARRETDGLVAALKLFDRGATPRRVEREIVILRRLDHPAIVRLLDEGRDAATGSTFAVTELVPDASPITEWALANARTPAERVELVGRLRAALTAAHAAGIVHCDLSPGNVLIAGDGSLRLVDFGIARLVDRGMTATHATAGTPVCMAPEQVDPSFGPIGPWTDEYAAAVLAYRLLAGVAPYEVGSTLLTAAQAITQVVPRPVREREPAVPAEVARWVDAALLKRVARRRRALADAGASPSRPWIHRAALVAAIAAAACAVAWWGESRGAVPPAEGRNAGQPAKESEQTMKSMLSAVVVGVGIVGNAMGQGGNVIAPEFVFPLAGNDGHADISGDLAVLGDLTYAGGGAARVFVRGSGGWAAGPILTPPSARVQFGTAVQVSADWVVVGDCKRDSARGVVHVWKRVGNALAFHQTLVAPDGASNDWFGWTAAINGGELFVSARLDDNWRGSIFRFGVNASGQWEYRQKIQSPNTNASDEIGWVIQSAGDLLVASAWLSECGYQSESGSLCVFKRAADGNYTQVYWTSDNLPGCTAFAQSVGLWGGAACAAVGWATPPHSRLFLPVSGVWTMVSELPSTTAVVHAESSWAVLYDPSPSAPGCRVFDGIPTSYLSNRRIAFPAGYGATIFAGGDSTRLAANGEAGFTIFKLDLPDCDSDGLPDPVEIAEGAPDANSNGVPDSCECTADVDESGAVNAVDLAAVLGVWGTSGGKYPRADIDGSGLVDAQDLAAVLGGWGSCP